MATPQSGQCRIWGRVLDVIKSASTNSVIHRLIQINANVEGCAGLSNPCAERSRNDLGQGASGNSEQALKMWNSVSSAPFDCDLELAVIDDSGPHALVFPCRRIPGGWMKTATKERLDVHPTHWRLWDQAQQH